MPRASERDVVRITGANASLSDDLRTRQRRYLWSMAVRTIAFIAAVALLHGWARWVGVLLAVVLPWFAVVVANLGRSSRVAAPLPSAPDRTRALTTGADDRVRTVVGTASDAAPSDLPHAEPPFVAGEDGPVQLTASRRT